MAQPTYYDPAQELSRTALCGVGKHGDCIGEDCECKCHEAHNKEE